MRHRKVDYISKIDLTAISAVILIVLFLLIYPFPHMPYPGTPRRINVDLPKVRSAQRLPDAIREDAVYVGVQRDGKVYVGYEQISIANLPMKLKEALATSTSQGVYVQADARAKYGTVKQVIDATAPIGVQKVSFITGYERAPYALW